MFRFLGLTLVLFFVSLPGYAAVLPWKEMKVGFSFGSDDARTQDTSLGTFQVAQPGRVYYYEEPSGSGSLNESQTLLIQQCGLSTSLVFFPTTDLSLSTFGRAYTCPSGDADHTQCLHVCAAQATGLSCLITGPADGWFNGDDMTNWDGDSLTQQRSWMTALPFSNLKVRFTSDVPGAGKTGRWVFTCGR